MTNNITHSNSNSSKWDDYLKSVKADKGVISHTKIGSKELNIYGGSYNITNLPEFWDKYYRHVFEEKSREYLTEKQLIEDGPLLVDVDLRYEKSVTERQHNKNHIIDLIALYANKLNLIYDIPDNSKINVYIYEKPDVNVTEDKTKDGIHIVFCIKTHKAVQCVLRKMVIDEIKGIWDNIPITNKYEDVFDEGITKGFVNWQVYGSRKPQHKAYCLTYYFELSYDNAEELWNFKESNVSKIAIKEHLPLMSARLMVINLLN